MTTNGKKPPIKRLRLLHMVVQPTYVIDDGATLEEQTANPIVIPGADWPHFTDRFREETENAERVLNETGQLPGTPREPQPVQ